MKNEGNKWFYEVKNVKVYRAKDDSEISLKVRFGLGKLPMTE